MKFKVALTLLLSAVQMISFGLASSAHAKTLPFAQGIYTALDLLHSEEHDRIFKAQQLLLLTTEFAHTPEVESLMTQAAKILQGAFSPVAGAPDQTQLATIHTLLGNALIGNRAKMNSSFLEESKLLETLLKAQFFHENFDLVKVTYENIDRDRATSLMLAYLTDPRAAKYDPEVVPLITGKYLDGSPAKERIVVTVPQGTYEIPAGEQASDSLKKLEEDSRAIVGNLPLKPNFQPVGKTRLLVSLEIKGFENISWAEGYARDFLAYAHGNRFLLFASEKLDETARLLENGSASLDSINALEGNLGAIVRKTEVLMKHRLVAGGWVDGGPEKVRSVMYERYGMAYAQEVNALKPGTFTLPTAAEVAKDKFAKRKFLVTQVKLKAIGFSLDGELPYVNEVPNTNTLEAFQAQASRVAAEAELARQEFKALFDLAREGEASFLPTSPAGAPMDLKSLNQWAKSLEGQHTLNHTPEGLKLDLYRKLNGAYEGTGRYYAELDGQLEALKGGKNPIDYLQERTKLPPQQLDRYRINLRSSRFGRQLNIQEDLARRATEDGSGTKIWTYSRGMRLLTASIVSYHVYRGVNQYLRSTDPEARAMIGQKYLVKVLHDLLYANAFSLEVSVTYDVITNLTRMALGKQLPFEIPTAEGFLNKAISLVGDLGYKLKGTSRFAVQLAELQSQIGLKPFTTVNGRTMNEDLETLRKLTVDFSQQKLQESELTTAQGEFRKSLTVLSGKLSTLIYVLNDRSNGNFDRKLGEFEETLYQQMVTSEKSYLQGVRRLFAPHALSEMPQL